MMGGWGMGAGLCGVGERVLATLLSLLGGSRGVGDTLARGARAAAETKGRFDRAMQSLLGVLNLPSKADYNRLLSKVEVLQGSLVNLNLKVDRLLAAREQQRPDPS
jgi:hypothetical protein